MKLHIIIDETQPKEDITITLHPDNPKRKELETILIQMDDVLLLEDEHARRYPWKPQDIYYIYSENKKVYVSNKQLRL